MTYRRFFALIAGLSDESIFKHMVINEVPEKERIALSDPVEIQNAIRNMMRGK